MSQQFWTREMENKLRELHASGVCSGEIAGILGVTQKSVRGKARRLGLRFAKQPVRYKGYVFKDIGGHRAADERSAELLRAAGVTI